MEGSGSHEDFLCRWFEPSLSVRVALWCVALEMKVCAFKWGLEIKGPRTWNLETCTLVWLCHTPASHPCSRLSECSGCIGCEALCHLLGGPPVTVWLRTPSGLQRDTAVQVCRPSLHSVTGETMSTIKRADDK